MTLHQDAPRESDLPVRLAGPARRALTEAGYTRLAQLTAITEAEVKQLHGMGPKAIDQLRRALGAQGLSFADGKKGEITMPGENTNNQQTPTAQRTPNPALSRLDALVGEWEMEVSVKGQLMARGKTAFEWLEGGAFLVQHVDAQPALPGAPTEWEANSPQDIATIIGLDDATERFCMLYADSRGVYRVYQMSVGDGVWKVWRDAPGFSQRFTGTFSDDGYVITAQWEYSSDGSHWEHDFDMMYKKVKSA